MRELREQDDAPEDPTTTFLDALKGEITEEVEKSMQSTRKDIIKMKQSLEQLSAAKTRAKQRQGQLRSIRKDVEEMRIELNRKSSRLQALEEGRHQRASSSRRSRPPRPEGIIAASESVLSDGPQSAKSSKRPGTAHEAARKDLELVHSKIDEKAVFSERKSKVEVEGIKAAVKSIQSRQLDSKTSEELGEIKNELALIKEQLQEREEASKIMKELGDLKKELEQLVNNAKKRSQDEGDSSSEATETTTITGKASSTSSNNSEQDDFFILSSEDDQMTHGDRTDRHAAQNSRAQDIEELQKRFEQQLRASEGRTWLELHSVKNLVAEINLRKIMSAKRRDADGRDIIAMRAELESMKKYLKLRRGLSTKVRKELETMKVELEEELADASNKSMEEISSLKQNVALLAEKSARLEENERKEGSKVKRELAALRKNLDSKAQVEEDLEFIKTELESRIEALDANDMEKLNDVKKIVEDIHPGSFDVWNDGEWKMLTKGVGGLKEKLIEERDGDGGHVKKGMDMDGTTAPTPEESDTDVDTGDAPAKETLRTVEESEENDDVDDDNVSYGGHDEIVVVRNPPSVASQKGEGKQRPRLGTINDSSSYPRDTIEDASRESKLKSLFGCILRSHHIVRSPCRSERHAGFPPRGLPPTTTSSQKHGNPTSLPPMADRIISVESEVIPSLSHYSECSGSDSQDDPPSLGAPTSSSTEILVNKQSDEVEARFTSPRLATSSTISTPRASNRTSNGSSPVHQQNQRTKRTGKDDDSSSSGLIDALFAKLQQQQQTASTCGLGASDSSDSVEDVLITVYTNPRVPSQLVLKDGGEVETIVENKV